MDIENMASVPTPPQAVEQSATQQQPIQALSHPGEVVYRLIFSSENIKRFSADDFDLTSKELITLKYDDCVLVLFYVENTESYQLADIWALVAQQVAGPLFAAVNMLSERKIAEAFTRLKSDGSHALHWAALRQYPFILVYRKRWPVAIYNGPREVQTLIDYALTLACAAGYYETVQFGGSMQGEARREMGPYDVYTNIPGNAPRVRTESLQYTPEAPIRGFNPSIPVVATGSQSAQRATNVVRREEAQQQGATTQGINTSLTPEQEQSPTLRRLTGETPPVSTQTNT